MKEVGNSWAMRASREVESIKREYLLRHFQQIALIAGKHYHHAFQSIKHLQRQPTRTTETLNRVIKRKKKFCFNMLVRKTENVHYQQGKAIILIAIFLERRMIGLHTQVFVKVKFQAELRKAQHLFLPIAVSNLNKLLTFSKAQAFYAIKAHQIIVNQEKKKAKLIKMATILAFCQTRLLFDSFLAISRPFSSPNHDEEDDGQIWVQAYRTMACCLNRAQETQGRGKPLRIVKKQAAVIDLASILSLKQRAILSGCLMDLACFQNHRFSPSALAVLRRQIAILEQQYESV